MEIIFWSGKYDAVEVLLMRLSSTLILKEIQLLYSHPDKVISILLLSSRGAGKTHKNRKGKTALEEAGKNRYNQVVAELSKRRYSVLTKTLQTTIIVL